MSVTKDLKTGKWMSQIRITNWKGDTIHKKKRGFRTKKEAQEWERDFLNQSSASLEMKFSDFIDVYFKDMEQRLKRSTQGAWVKSTLMKCCSGQKMNFQNLLKRYRTNQCLMQYL